MSQGYGDDRLARPRLGAWGGVESWGAGCAYPERYTYDAASGNLASKAGVNYNYNSGHAHAPSSLSNGSTYQYDANGNMIQRVVGGQTFNLGYDAENRLVSVSGAVTASFVYDGDGNRVKSTIAGTTTYFVGNIYEVSGGTITKYYYLGGSRVAIRQGSNVYYLLSDHLGSTTVTTDVNGAVVAELRYKPWGEVRSGSAPTKYTFTGQYSNTTDFGLMFYNARWYDPALGRFASADSVVPPGLQGYDRYAYANNNPVNYTDPTGHFGKHRDDKSDYWNKRNQHNVKNLEAKWEREKAEKGLKQLVQATMKELEFAGGLSASSAVSGGYTLAVAGGCLWGDWSLQSLKPENAMLLRNNGGNPWIPTVGGIGLGGIAGFFPAQGTGGVDGVYIAPEKAFHIFPYTGVAASGAGGGVTGGPYAIVGWNIHSAQDYTGFSNVASLTVARGHGVTVSYFWSGEGPLEAGRPQGLGLWYSPGLGASASLSRVTYYDPWVTIH